MGARRYDQSAQRFLQLDQYQGALADLSLASDPLTQNRYNLGASNPLSGIEWDGHMVTQASAGGGCSPNPSCATTGSTSTTNAGGPGTSGCPWSVFKLGACASERGAAGTTPEQVKQSFIYASQTLATAVPPRWRLQARRPRRQSSSQARRSSRPCPQTRLQTR
jgi:hypothetical protein